MSFIPLALYGTEGKNKEEAKLANCYKNSLQLAVDNNCKTISFPNISTGIYHFPKKLAAEIAVATVKDFLSATDKIEKVVFVCFDEENCNLYEQLIEGLPLMSFRRGTRRKLAHMLSRRTGKRTSFLAMLEMTSLNNYINFLGIPVRIK